MEGEDVAGRHGFAGHGADSSPSQYDRPMTTLQGEYEPSPSQWVRDQVAEYEASGGQRANTLLDTGMPIIVVATRGAKSGKVRKNPVMKVEHDGEYALVASKGGAPENPEWYHNLVAHPDEVVIQDGPEPFAVHVREVERRREGEVVGARRGRLPALRRVPGEDGPPDPGVHRQPQERLRRLLQRASAKACTMAARQGTRFALRSSGVLPRRTTTRSRVGQIVIDCPS